MILFVIKFDINYQIVLIYYEYLIFCDFASQVSHLKFLNYKCKFKNKPQQYLNDHV